MIEPGFRVLTKEELQKRSVREQIDYMRQLVEHLRGQIADTKASIKTREEWLKKSNDSLP